MDDSKFLITGAGGQLGLALQAKYPNARATDSKDLDITNSQALAAFDWGNVTTILNAAAYTDVEGAQTPEGEALAWDVNDKAVGNLAGIVSQKDLTLVHISTDYVFDGSKNPHTEDEPFSPLGVYGQTKAAGDMAASKTPKHYIIRTSWVIGDGKNFVRTMLDLGQRGINPTVVSDQIGRPTFTAQLVNAIDHLLRNQQAFGIYNVSDSGEPVSWADLARAVFKEAGLANSVTDTTTASYYKDKPQAAPRPLNSIFDLSKIQATGLKLTDWRDDLAKYIKKELSK